MDQAEFRDDFGGGRNPTIGKAKAARYVVEGLQHAAGNSLQSATGLGRSVLAVTVKASLS